MTRGSQKIRIKSINSQLVEMSSLVEKQIFQSMVCLKDFDMEKIEEVIENDDIVDNMQKVIEEDCIKFIATEQPLARDLRKVFTASKIVTDLERMADHAVDICKLTKRMNKSVSSFKNYIDLLYDMETKVRKMITESIDSYIKEDVELAYKICEEDNKIDELYCCLLKKIVKSIEGNEELVNDGTRLLFVIKYLERIADHVTNICEWTIFSKNGTYVDLNE